MPPFQGGGDMIRSVTLREDDAGTTLPHKFEAGTPNIAGAIGLGAAIDYLQRSASTAIAAHEHALPAYAHARSCRARRARASIGTARDKRGVLSFVIDGVHPHDIGTILDQRRRRHPRRPPLRAAADGALGVPATARASFALYNTRQDVDALIAGLAAVRQVFA